MSAGKFNIYCKLSGVFIGSIDYPIVAGHLPWVTSWKESIIIHPIFGLPTHRLLAYARGVYNDFVKELDEEDGIAASSQTEQDAKVAFLAVLQSLKSIKQEAPALPDSKTVYKHMPRLIKLAYWLHYLDSHRFSLPYYKINRTNANVKLQNIGDYLDVCYDKKDSYETATQEIEERHKAAAAEAAMKALRNSWVIPTSSRALWKWVRAHLPAKYEADAIGWMGTLFLGSEKTICEFDADEIRLMEEIIVGECPGGTGVLKAVRERLDHIEKVARDNREAFSVDLTDYETPEAAAGIVVPEPDRKDFPNQVLYIKARAVWFLGQSAARKQQGL